MGTYMGREGLSFGMVLCSSARRTRETVELALPHGTPEVEVVSGLYLATPDEMLEIVQEVASEVHDVLIVGHNPGTHDLAVSLAGKGPSSLLARLHEKFPTGALASLAFHGAEWSAVTPGKGRLERFVRPKDLPDAERLRL